MEQTTSFVYVNDTDFNFLMPRCKIFSTTLIIMFEYLNLLSLETTEEIEICPFPVMLDFLKPYSSPARCRPH